MAFERGKNGLGRECCDLGVEVGIPLHGALEYGVARQACGEGAVLAAGTAARLQVAGLGILDLLFGKALAQRALEFFLCRRFDA